MGIYYRQDGERIESGLYKIGHIEGGVEGLNISGLVNLKITAINSNTELILCQICAIKPPQSELKSYKKKQMQINRNK